MRSSKLYSILRDFSKIEQNRFRKYLQSPYFNRSAIIIELFNIIAADINEEGNIDLKKEVIWENLELNASFDDTRFRKYSSDLLKHLENFLSQQAYEEDSVYQASFLISAIGDRKLEKLYNSSIRSAQRMIHNYPSESSTYYYHKYKIERNYFDLIEFETRRADKSNVGEINTALDIFYISEKLKFYNYILSQKHISPHEYRIQFIEDIIKFLDGHDYLSIPRIALYFQTCLTYLEPENEDHYHKLKNLLNEHATKLPAQEAKDDLYMSAQNYCIRKANQGNQLFLKELFILYQDIVEKGIVIAEGEISPWYYRNIVTTALRLGEYDWIENFIYGFRDKLPESYRENAFTFSLAQSYFYQKKFDKVIELLREIEYEDFTYNLNSKVMLLFTYYEIDEIEPLYSLFESFRVYLNRNKQITDNRKTLYKNLISFTKRLTKIMPGDNKAIEKLKKEVEATSEIANKGWLKQKIDELQGV